MKRTFAFGLAAVAVLCWAVGANAATDVYSGSVNFQSDLEDPKTINLPAFDTQGGTCTLLDVTVDVHHSGQVHPRADNDDAFQGADVNARMIRTMQAVGPGVGAFDSKTITSSVINLLVDDGDGGDPSNFDDTPPDGHDFGFLLYMGQMAGIFNPPEDLYDDGPGVVSFNVTPVLMVNDLQWVTTPDAWQLEVEAPNLFVQVDVTYEYECLPEPASLSLMLLGGLVLLRRRR